MKLERSPRTQTKASVQQTSPAKKRKNQKWLPLECRGRNRLRKDLRELKKKKNP